MQLTQESDQVILVLNKSEADKISDQLLKLASQCDRTTLDFTYLTAEAVLALENSFKQPAWFEKLVTT
ncbi:hypothetical protein [Acidithiobacillus thiooxidans]|uniref:hypothetical protein n=1 Tax=Acidithiobacillus thiooxidans TaxID=930 RepID=UPI0004E260DF|nr:hypothetical protein [Acidithiobacillus thiooxidans]